MSGKQRGITLTGALIGHDRARLRRPVRGQAPARLHRVLRRQEDPHGDGRQRRDQGPTVKEIRNAFDRRNTIEGVQAVRGEDLEITKEGGEAVVTATWSTKVPIIANFSACLDFSVTTAK